MFIPIDEREAIKHVFLQHVEKNIVTPYGENNIVPVGGIIG